VTLNQALLTIEQAPFAVLLGLKIESARDGQATARLPFDRKALNAGDLDAPIHGGAIAAIVDFAACAAVWSLPETTRSATIAMTVNFTGPGVGTDLIAHARVRSKGKRVAHLVVDVRDASGALIADGLVTYKIS
jgi:uncharacterized protein (TIGR00369 family)